MQDSNITQDDTLYCPKCAYNLAALPENRCPECGETFDPDDLRRRVAEYAKSRSAGRIVLLLLVGPAVFLGATGFEFVTNVASGGFFAFTGGGLGLILAIVNTVVSARRVIRPHPFLPITGSQHVAGFFLGLGFFLAQMFFSFLGCGFCVWVSFSAGVH